MRCRAIQHILCWVAIWHGSKSDTLLQHACCCDPASSVCVLQLSKWTDVGAASTSAVQSLHGVKPLARIHWASAADGLLLKQAQQSATQQLRQQGHIMRPMSVADDPGHALQQQATEAAGHHHQPIPLLGRPAVELMLRACWAVMW